MRSVIALFALFAVAFAGDCVGSFGTWGVCDGQCGAQSTQNRFYSIQIPATAGGQPCPKAAGDFESRPCTVMCSTENCVGGWLISSPCASNGVCGSDAGTEKRTYQVTRPKGPGGADCPTVDGTIQTLGCSAPVTPCAGCEGSWGEWSTCVSDGVCNSALGHAKRTFTITREAEPGGNSCAATNGKEETKRCSAAITPCVGCEGHFGPASTCASDGICDSSAGKRTMTYYVTRQAETGGATCPHGDNEVVTEACQAPITPCQHCTGHWTEFSGCVSDGQCGSASGKKQRTFNVDQAAGPGGRACEANDGFVQIVDCEATITPCKGCVGSWSEFSDCVSDGQCSSDAGHHQRTYTITEPGEVGGTKCQARNGQVQRTTCSAPITPCPPEACEGSFSAYSECKANACGTTIGKQSRTFSVTKDAKFGGTPCEQANGFVETVECVAPLTPCPVACVGSFDTPVCVSDGVCDDPTGTQTETFIVTTEAANGGTRCPYANGYVRKSKCKAAITPCPPEACEGSWSEWNECKVRGCGSGAGDHSAIYTITKNAKYGGKECEAAQGQVRTEQCEGANVPCPVDCIGAFSEWSGCQSKGICSNSAGTHKRTYKITVPAAHGGNACNHKDGDEQTEDCEATITPCPPEPCIGSWVDSSKCTQTKCDAKAGTYTQVYEVTKQSKYGGAVCEAVNADVRTLSCEVPEPIERCPIDCKGSYKRFSECTAVHKCGSTEGRRSRVFEVATKAEFGGRRCPREDKSVETEDCAVPLVLCPPVHCEGYWSEPSACKQINCDEPEGTNSQKFTVTVPAAHGGTDCEAKNKQIKHNNCTIEEDRVVHCPISCVGKWNAPSECVAIEECGCNKGSNYKTFEVVTKAQFGGAECQYLDGQKVQQKCVVPANKVERCPNELLDAPCEDLKGLLTEAKNTRCQLEAIIAALEGK